MPPRICIVAPVFNERRNLESLVQRLDAALADVAWEILFVDDDSPDGSAEEIRRIARFDPRVRLILRIADPGLANSCIQGMLSSTADLLCVMDADGQHDPMLIRDLIQALETAPADLASACRELAGADCSEALGVRRSRLSRLGNSLIRWAIRRETRDPLSGFFVIRREACLAVVRRLSNSGFKLLFDILASHPGLRHVEVPFRFQPRQAGESKLDALAIWQFGALLAEKLSRGWLPARAVSFLAVGALGLLVHLAALYAALGISLTFAAAQFTAALTAMTCNFALNNALTFRDRRFHGVGLIRGWLAYLAICSAGLLANVSMASWVYERLQGLALPAALAGIAMDTLWKFVISDRVLWRRRRTG
ncbi:MAG: glycosyltransferase [Betaproteobacteria bacterium]|nr:glycosyltransferase [Betaproteobacteria bacterium]